MSNEDARIHFNGICPYTGIACGWWECQMCGIEKREREWVNEISSGGWIRNPKDETEWMCPNCGEVFDCIPECMGTPLFKFCPECGRRMNNEED